MSIASAVGVVPFVVGAFDAPLVLGGAELSDLGRGGLVGPRGPEGGALLEVGRGGLRDRVRRSR